MTESTKPRTKKRRKAPSKQAVDGDTRFGRYGKVTRKRAHDVTPTRSHGRPATLAEDPNAITIDLVELWRAAGLLPSPPIFSKDSWHLAYAKDVVDGRVLTGDLVRQVCRRQLRLHEMPLDGWEFRWDLLTPFILFVAAAPHVKGIWSERDELLELQPWQTFILGEMYGWRRIADEDERLYQRVICQVAKKNGKTLMAALIALWEFRYVRPKSGTEVYSVATSLDQAKLCFDTASRIVSRIARGILDDVRIANGMMSYGDSCQFVPMSRESKQLEGKNPSCVIFDEAALIDDANIFANLQTAAAGRQGRHVEFYITTAQGRLSSPYTEMRSAISDDIRKDKLGNRVLPMLYELDVDDKPLTDEAVWIKANPNLDVTVMRDFLKGITEDASRSLTRRSAILQKHFNMWLGSDMHSWLNLDDWDACGGTPISEGPCYVGVDLASVSDLCAVAMLFTPTPRTAHLQIQCWMSRLAFDGLSSSRRPFFEDGLETGELRITEGKTTDLTEVEDYVAELMTSFDVQLVGADPHNAQSMLNRLEDQWPDNVLIVRPNRGVMNSGIREMERYVLDGRLTHSGSRFLRWQAANTRVDVAPTTELCLLKKPHAEDKIDAITAGVVAFRCKTEPRDIFTGFSISFA